MPPLVQRADGRQGVVVAAGQPVVVKPLVGAIRVGERGKLRMIGRVWTELRSERRPDPRYPLLVVGPGSGRSRKRMLHGVEQQLDRVDQRPVEIEQDRAGSLRGARHGAGTLATGQTPRDPERAGAQSVYWTPLETSGAHGERILRVEKDT